MKRMIASAAALLAATATPVYAQDGQRQIQVKVLGSAVLTDGRITRVDRDVVGLPATLQTRSNDNAVPTIAVEYFFSDRISAETICCMTQHDVDAVAGLPGAELVANAKVVPATVTVKYHVPLGAAKPYVGVGPAYFLWLDSKPGAATIPLGVTRQTLSNELGLVVQTGVDVPLNDRGLGLSLDAKRYFIDTTARWYAGQTVAIETRHTLDPWVLSAGLAWRF